MSKLNVVLKHVDKFEQINKGKNREGTEQRTQIKEKDNIQFEMVRDNIENGDGDDNDGNGATMEDDKDNDRDNGVPLKVVAQ